MNYLFTINISTNKKKILSSFENHFDKKDFNIIKAKYFT